MCTQELTCESLYQCFFIMIATFLPGGGPRGNIDSPSLVEDEQLWCVCSMVSSGLRGDD
jgi:hypothetical protein